LLQGALGRALQKRDARLRQGRLSENQGYLILLGDYWYCFWGFLSFEAQKSLMKFQKNNHFVGSSQVGRKVRF
jgi:hypothetical protein